MQGKLFEGCTTSHYEDDILIVAVNKLHQLTCRVDTPETLMLINTTNKEKIANKNGKFTNPRNRFSLLVNFEE